MVHVLHAIYTARDRRPCFSREVPAIILADDVAIAPNTCT